eukprot:scaffold38180_cov41-Phaeocystis_antarctica.AAC.2
MAVQQARPLGLGLGSATVSVAVVATPGGRAAGPPSARPARPPRARPARALSAPSLLPLTTLLATHPHRATPLT